MIVAIAGGSGSGKSTLAAALARRIGARVISEDDYYVCASAIENFSAAAYNFDTPDAKQHDLLIEHLRRFKAGQPFDKPIYDLVSHKRSEHTERIDPVPALIVDGIHVLAHPGLRDAFDVKVFVGADEALRLGRRMIRDMVARGREPESVMRQFFSTVRPMHALHVEPQRALADLVVEFSYDDGEQALEAAVRRIEQFIRTAELST